MINGSPELATLILTLGAAILGRTLLGGVIRRDRGGTERRD